MYFIYVKYVNSLIQDGIALSTPDCKAGTDNSTGKTHCDRYSYALIYLVQPLRPDTMHQVDLQSFTRTYE